MRKDIKVYKISFNLKESSINVDYVFNNPETRENILTFLNLPKMFSSKQKLKKECMKLVLMRDIKIYKDCVRVTSPHTGNTYHYDIVEY